jgi:NSS family neurotransmitter:Na+ symporter
MIYVGWYLKKDVFYEELSAGVKSKNTLALRPIIFFIVKYISPIVILLVFLNGIGVF